MHIIIAMLMIASRILTLMQGHSGSAEKTNQRLIMSTTMQVINVKLATTVGHFYMTLTLKTYNHKQKTILFLSVLFFVVQVSICLLLTCKSNER